ncbi:hypothetical protein HDU98_006220 [Podochytrium sp. JEL0797]|nr:hypothetical protein HDU98_006220 [Podochytrium sp. JEL0797]
MSLIARRLFSSTPVKRQQFLLLAHDFTDSGALERRMHVRNDHMYRAQVHKREGSVVLGGAMLAAPGDDAAMVGSMLVLDFPTRAEAEAFVLGDPYITGKVWEKWTLTPFKMAPLADKKDPSPQEAFDHDD